jgi:hypothetical protein
MKAVVGTSGMCGFPNHTKYPKGGGYQHCSGACATLADPIIVAQLAVSDYAKYPEFKGNVASVETRVSILRTVHLNIVFFQSDSRCFLLIHVTFFVGILSQAGVSTTTASCCSNATRLSMRVRNFDSEGGFGLKSV